MLLGGRAVVGVVAGALATVGAALVPSSARAVTWTPVPSGTTATIAAVEYQGPDRFWFATADGRIFRRSNGTFDLVHNDPGTEFADLEMHPDGVIGLAVGDSGEIARTTDGGATWSPLALPAAGNPDDPADCNPSFPAGHLETVRIAPNGEAWVMGEGAQLWRTAVPPTPSQIGTGWTFANNGPGASCLLVDRHVDDVFLPPGPGAYLLTQRFDGGTVFATPDRTAVAATARAGAGPGGASGRLRLVGDPAAPQRQWAVGPGPNASFFAATGDAWQTSGWWSVPDDGLVGVIHDLDVAGGTVLAAGAVGMVLASWDGTLFHRVRPTMDDTWRAVSLAADGANGAIGGDGGRLMVTADANAIPAAPPAPPGPPGGPAAPGGPGGPGAAGGGGAGSNPSPGGARPSLPRGSFRLEPIVVTQARGRWRVVVRGTLRPPAGVSARQGCGGDRLTVRLLKGRRTLARRTVTLDSRCAFAVRVGVSRARVGRARSLRIALAFGGSPAVGRTSRTVTARIRG